MGKRREIREQAVKLLYSSEVSALPEDEQQLHRLWHLIGAEGGEPRSDIRSAATELATRVQNIRPELDQMIIKYTANYSIARIASVDRNILRLALYEMHHRNDVPPVVAINEAIEIAKRFGCEDSGRFVNGVLDRAKQDLNRPLRDPQPTE